MIKTQEEFLNACEFIESDVELYDFQLSDRMSSYEYNLYLQDSEYFLNFLYEKIRTLEELCDYLDEYVDVKITRARESIKEDTRSLKQTLSTVTDTESHTCIPEWDMGMTVLDRDGSEIGLAALEEGVIEGASRKVNYVTPLSIKRIDENQIYAESADTFVNTGRYLVSCVQDEVTIPEIRVRVAVPEEEYDTLSFDPINAEISTEKDEQDIILKIRPTSYNKEKRPLQFGDFHNMENMFPEKYDYDEEESHMFNLRSFIGRKNERMRRDYYQDVVDMQRIAEEQQYKSGVFDS